MPASYDYTTGSIDRGLVRYAVPYLLAYFLQTFYGLVDLYVVGRYGSVASTTAVAVGSQLMHMLTVVIVGLAMGSTVLVARATGARDSQRVSLAVGNTATLFIALSLTLAVGLTIGVRGVVSLLDVPADAVAASTDYLAVCFLGLPFVAAYNVLAAVIRGSGDSRTPLYFVVVACVVNIALDFLLVGGLGMDATGAALATVLSQAVSVALAMWWTVRRGGPLVVGRHHLRPRRAVMRPLLAVGVPVAVQDGCIQIAFLVVTVIANRRGLDDAAAVGIVEKVIGLLFLVPSAMLSTVSTLAAHNLGAGRHDRARAVLRRAVLYTSAYGLAVAVAMQIVSPAVVGLFTSSGDVTALGAGYLRSYAWDCFLAGIHFCFSGYFCACGRASISFVHNLVSIVVARVPLAYLFSLRYPASLYPMGLAAPIGSAVSVVICLIFYRAMMPSGSVASAFGSPAASDTVASHTETP